MRFFHAPCFWLWLFCAVSVPVFADAKPAEPCNPQLSNCSVSTGSLAWWDNESLRLNSLFESQQYDELYGALRPWIDNTNVPDEYQPVVAMLFGKWLHMNGREQESDAQLERALSGFTNQYSQTHSQQSALKALNLLVILNRFEQAKMFADELINQHYDDPVFYREMYAEMGHIAHQNNNKEDHIKYRLASLNWARRVPDKQQQSIAYNNYAVALRNIGDHQHAEQAFLDGLECAKAAGDLIHVNIIKLRLAELAYLQQHIEDSSNWLRKIDLAQLSYGYIESYREISLKVNTAKFGATP